MHIFDGIFQCDDVDIPILVDAVQDGSHGGRLAGTRGAGEEDQTIDLFRHLGEGVGELVGLEGSLPLRGRGRGAHPAGDRAQNLNSPRKGHTFTR